MYVLGRICALYCNGINIVYNAFMSNSIVAGNSDTLTTADKQKFIMDKIRQDEVTLYRDTYL